MRSTPEGSLVVRVYRRLLSESTRYRIARRIPLRLRYKVKRVAAAVARTAPDLLAIEFVVSSKINPAFYKGRNLQRVVAQGRPRIASVAPNLTPLDARARNLEAVSKCLEDACIDYFCVRGDVDTLSTIAVSQSDWPNAIDALRKLALKTSGYVGMHHGERQRASLECRPATKRRVWSRRASATAIRFVWFWTDPSHRLVLGEKYGCEVEPWDDTVPGILTARRRNRVSQEVDSGLDTIVSNSTLFTRLSPTEGKELSKVRTRQEFTRPRPDDIEFPIDVVFTWVDGADESWMRERAAETHIPYHEEADNESRYLNRDELKYALRSIQTNASWVRHIYIVTANQTPAWLNTDDPGITLINHRDIFSDETALPTFNSHAIESQIHHIEGLSEHFLYFNDDMLLGAEVIPQRFFHANGLTSFFPSPANVPQGPIRNSDVPVAVAAKNNRVVLEKKFGVSLTQKMKHAPYPLRRSILFEIEHEFAEEFRVTMLNKLRSTSDISVASSFYHYYAYLTGRAVPANIKYVYVDLGMPDAPRTIGRLAATRSTEAFCLNTTAPDDDEVSFAELETFLESYFPLPSRFERQ